MPRVSVIMPCYNPQIEYLREAVNSILGQTFSDFELLIIDDGSNTPQAEQFLTTYSDPRVKFIKRNHEGIAGTLNYGIEIAKGEFIARMDSDDIALPKRLEKQVAFLDANPDISVCGTKCHIFPLDFKFWYPKNPKLFDLLCQNQLVHPTVMFRRADFIKYDLFYDPEYNDAEDYELWTRVARVLKIANLDEILLKYRTHVHSISSTKHQTQNLIADKVRQNILNYLTDDGKMQAQLAALSGVFTNKAYKYRLFGFITLIKVNETPISKTYFLFGIIPILKTQPAKYKEKTH